MRFLLTSLTLTFLSACATAPPAHVVKAPVVGFVRGLKINDQSVPNGVCALWFGSTKVPLSEGAFFTTELPVGANHDVVISCDRGLFQSSLTLKIDREVDVQPDALNLLAEYTIKLSTERNAVGMYLLGGQITGQFGLRPLSREGLKKVVAENSEFKGMKQASAIKFDYFIVPR